MSNIELILNLYKRDAISLKEAEQLIDAVAYKYYPYYPYTIQTTYNDWGDNITTGKKPFEPPYIVTCSESKIPNDITSSEFNKKFVQHTTHD